MAAGTLALSHEHTYVMGDGTQRTVFSILCTSGSSSFTSTTLSALLTASGSYTPAQVDTIMNSVKGGVLLAIGYAPDGTSTPTSNPRVKILDQDNAQIFDHAFTAATDYIKDGKEELSFYVPLSDFTFSCTTMANGKIAYFNIWIEH